MKEIDNTLVFENDDEFTEFCTFCTPSVHTSDEGNPYYDYDFTPDYVDACNAGKKFAIEDPQSKIVKRGAVCRGFITKPVTVYCYIA